MFIECPSSAVPVEASSDQRGQEQTSRQSSPFSEYGAILHIVGARQILDRLHFSGIHLHTFLDEEMSQKLDTLLIESALVIQGNTRIF